MDRYLFRGKRLDNGELVIGFYYRTSNGTRIHEVQDEIPFCLESNVHLVDPATVGQCTGLKDKNGKLIFEGDIVKFSKDGETVGVIEYIDDRFVIVVGMWCGDLGHYVKVVNLSIEVIGNIHDSPALFANGATA